MAESGFYVELGQRVQQHRRKLGMTQEDLASALSLKRTSIANIEKGRQKILVHTLVVLARSLKVTLPELVPDMPGEPELDDLLKDKTAAAQAFVRSAVVDTQTPTRDER